MVLQSSCLGTENGWDWEQVKWSGMSDILFFLYIDGGLEIGQAELDAVCQPSCLGTLQSVHG